jgi:peroxiredoxin
LQGVKGELEQHGATLVALTPHVPDHSKTMVEKHRIDFDLLSDPRNDYAAELGLRFELPADLKAVYAGFGLDLPKYNGDDSWTLPMPARLVIDRTGIVRAADVDPDYTTRPEPSKTVADVAALARG